MRHVRDVIRMKAAGMPSREIARRVRAAPSTVRLTIRRFEAAGLTWPLPDAVLDRLVHNAHRLDLAGESLRRTRQSAQKT
jgi:IS30 family transposase